MTAQLGLPGILPELPGKLSGVSARRGPRRRSTRVGHIHQVRVEGHGACDDCGGPCLRVRAWVRGASGAYGWSSWVRHVPVDQDGLAARR